MARKQNQSDTNAQQVRKQNQQAAQQQGQGQFGTEFAAETDVQSVKRRNQKSQQNKQ